MAERRNWTRTETLLAFRLYCNTPFGKLHQHNPDVIMLAERIGRTPSAVGMKACNFASLDQLHQARGIVGLSNRSKVEEEIWGEFLENSEAIAYEAEQAHERFDAENGSDADSERLHQPDGPTEVLRTIRTRRVQSFFRTAVLTSYSNRCGLTGLAVPSLLNASHIIPWADSDHRRADPTNGICLNALHDRAFDRGYISFDNQFRLIISPLIRNNDILGDFNQQLRGIEGHALSIPERFGPSQEAMAFHRERVFKSN